MQASDHSLGPYLRAEREQQGIDLAEIASLTKIQPKFIEALEADNYDQLPKGPFVTGFLRSYAQCLSLDADEIIAFFQTHHGRQPPNPPVQPRQQPTPPRPALFARVSWQHGAILGVGLVTLGLILFFALPSKPVDPQVTPPASVETEAATPPTAEPIITAPTTPPAHPTPEETTALNPAALPAPLSEAPATETEPSATEIPPDRAAPPEAPDAVSSEGATLEPEPLVLRVQALEETWMRLDIDDETRQEALIQAGESVEWKAKNQFSLTIGNVKGARVLLNDQELDLPATRSNVLRDYVLTRALFNPRDTD